MAHGLYIFGVFVMAMMASGCSTSSPNADKIQKLNQSTVQLPSSTIDGTDRQAIDQHTPSIQVGSQQHFFQWFDRHQDPRLEAYQSYLARHLTGDSLPPMHQLLTTARSWQSCDQPPYQVPPEDLWPNILPTLRLYDELKRLNILPKHAEIRSVYRNPALNACAGGAPGSKHLHNSAIDIWVPDVIPGSPELFDIQNKLCHYWLMHGERHNFGLGLYATGAIHLDTQGYRKWGAQHSESTSVCRQPVAVPTPSLTDG